MTLNMRALGILLISALVIVSCNKDKVATKPSIKITSINGNVIPFGAGLVVEMDFTDKEGDISNTMFVQKIRKNIRTTATIRDTFSLAIPSFPVKSTGEIQLNMDYNNYLVSAINPPKKGTPPNEVFEDDTLEIRFALRDLAGNVSDTVSAGTIVVLRNN
jgi:hypothetical protein